MISNLRLLFTVLFLAIGTTGISQTIDLLVRPSFPFGFKRTEIPFSSSNNKFRAGSGAALEAGGRLNLSESLSIQSTIGYHYTFPGFTGLILNIDSADDVDFSSLFFTAGGMYSLKTGSKLFDRFIIGAGVAQYFPFELEFNTPNARTIIDYRSATAGYLEIGSRIRIKSYLYVDATVRSRYLVYRRKGFSTSSLTPLTSGLEELDASGVEMAATIVFKLTK